MPVSQGQPHELGELRNGPERNDGAGMRLVTGAPSVDACKRGPYHAARAHRLGYRLRVLLRRPASVSMQTASAVIGDLARPLNMSAALEGVDAVIHSAGLAHAMAGVPEDD